MRQVEAAWLGRSKVLHYTVSIIYERLIKKKSRRNFVLSPSPSPHPPSLPIRSQSCMDGFPACVQRYVASSHYAYSSYEYEYYAYSTMHIKEYTTSS